MNITYNSPINSTGYGVASLNILKELSNLSNISLFPIGSPSVTNQTDYDIVKSLLDTNISNLDVKAPTIKIWHQFDLLSRIGNGLYFAYPIFELDTFNDYEKKNLKVPDHIFVSSEWAKNIVIENEIVDSPVSVVPLGVDRNIFNETIPTTRNDNKYVFLNMGKWEIRKGHDILLDLFNKAFPTETDVELWILASEKTNGYSNENELKEWKNFYASDRVKIFSGFDTQQEIAQLIANADCGIFPSRAEGWNLELLESMSMGKPVISTNFSAHTEFCDSDNCYLVNIDQKEPAYDGKAFQKQGNWAKIGTDQKDQFIEHMRNVYRNRIIFNSNGIKTSLKYSWKNSAQTIIDILNRSGV